MQAKKNYESKLMVSAKDVNETLCKAVEPNGEVPEDFRCNICLQLVADPQECTKCNQLFCKGCI